MTMTAQELKLDYFKFYDVANQSAGQVVALQGQFDKQPERVQLPYLNFFANPASKNGEPIYDKNAHLTWYNVYDPVPDPVRVVQYENQFGKQELYTGRTYGLLAPTQKEEKGSGFPTNLDHYKVYQVVHGQPLQKAVKVEDQFGAGETRIVYPIFFAVPVKIWYEGQTYEIHNDKAHLVIYRIFPGAEQKSIVTRDWFGRHALQVYQSVLLGAPSVKLAWKEA
jgi:hypothetical protein